VHEVYTTILYEVDQQVALITFNRPEKLNALNVTMVEELTHALEQIHESNDIRALILTGAGNGFMAGADIAWYAKQTEQEFRLFQNKAQRMYSLIEKNEKPVIAAVNGYALGGGFEVVLCCDLVFAADQAMMGLPEIHLNLIPGGGGTQRLPRKIGVNRANEMLLTGGQYAPAQLKEWGIINRITSQEELIPEARAFALPLVKRTFKAVSSIKQLTHMACSDDSEGFHYEAQIVAKLFSTEEARQRIQAFVDKASKSRLGNS
jgi:enoyl-CoA hydratase/carnithine racemase